MDVRVAEVARAHGGLVAWHLLLDAGLTERRAKRAVAELRRLHDGVFLTGHGPLTDHQRRLAATLTAPSTVLSHASSGAHWGFRPWKGGFETVTRPGSGGPQRIGELLVSRSSTLTAHVTQHNRIPVTTPARTIIVLAPRLTDRERAKAVREAIRLRVMTALELRLALADHRGRRGTRGLAELAARLERLPIGRTRSDAEARALEVLDAAGITPPNVNVRIDGEEADLSWPPSRRIIEIDGPQFHQDPEEDRARSGHGAPAAGRSTASPHQRCSTRRSASSPSPGAPNVEAPPLTVGPSTFADRGARPTPRRGASAPPRGTAAS